MMVDGGYLAEARASLESALAEIPTSGLLTQALARFLALAPDLSQRDGERAVVLAQRVFAAQSTLENLELVAEALAEAGRCEEAAAHQRQALEAAAGAEAGALGSDHLAILVSTLQRFEAGAPCRAPGASSPAAGPEDDG